MSRKSIFSLITIFLVVFYSTAKAQESSLNSLHEALNTAADDTVKMFAINDLASFYVENNRDSANYYIDSAIELATKIDQVYWVASFKLTKAYLLQRQSNTAQSYKLCMEALAIVEDVNTEKSMHIPKGYEFSTDPTKFRKYLLIFVYHQLGNTISRAANNDLAITYYKKEIVIADEINTQDGRMTSNMNIGAIFLSSNELDSAFIYATRALQAAEITGFKDYEGYTLRIIGEVYFKKGIKDSALHYYRKALAVNKIYNNLSTDGLIYNSISDLFESQNEPDSMYLSASTALQLATQLKTNTSPAAERVAKAWALLGNVDSAYAYLSLAKEVGDSLSRDLNEKLIEYQNVNFEEQLSLEKQVQSSIVAKNKIRTTALGFGLLFLSVVVFVFYRNNKQKQKFNERLSQTLLDLKSTQSQLIQSEKMASLGELTAGVAHEIQNPLNFVNNFSELNKELIDEQLEEIEKGDWEEAKELAQMMKANGEKINHHGKRADAIVKGMLAHSRTSSGEKVETDINALADEYLRLSYHGLRAKDHNFNADFKTDFDPNLPKVNAIPQDIGRVLLNLINNAFQASSEVEKPLVQVSTKRTESGIEISVTDNGPGIPDNIKDKIFQPFFTTKPTGQGTGLGLSLSYDIIEAHGGKLLVESSQGVGTKFTISLITKDVMS